MLTHQDNGRRFWSLRMIKTKSAISFWEILFFLSKYDVHTIINPFQSVRLEGDNLSNKRSQKGC